MIKAFKKCWKFMFADFGVFMLNIAAILIACTVIGTAYVLIFEDKDNLRSQKSDTVDQNIELLNQTTNLLNRNTILFNSTRSIPIR